MSTIAAATPAVRRGTNPVSRAVTAAWLGHRAALVGIGLVVVVFALVIVVPGLKVSAAYAWYATHHCTAAAATGTQCQLHGAAVVGEHAWAYLVGFLLLLVPLVAGVFVGAPLVAREIESGTFRFTWTFGIGRTRYELRRLVVLAAAAVVGATVLGLLMGWFAHPLEALDDNSRFDARLFNTTVLTLPAWTIFSLALGTALGVAVRRTVAAMAGSAVVAGGLLVLAGEGARDGLTSALLSVGAVVRRSERILYTFSGPTTQSGSFPNASWVVRSWVRAPSGKTLTGTTLWAVLERRPKSARTPQSWLVAHHYTFWYAYQPADRYWTFELLVAAGLVLVAAGLVTGAFALIRRFG